MPGVPSADEVVRLLGGHAHYRDIVRHTTRHALRLAVRDGRLRRTGRGTYSLPDASSARRAAAALGGLVSHASAARHWKLETLLPPEAAHVVVPRGTRRAPRRGVVLHYGDVPPQDEIDGVTSPLRTVLDCAATLPLPEALAVADSALRLGVVARDDLLEAAVRRRGAGRRRILTVAENADERAATAFESALRGVLLARGIGGFVPQLPVTIGTTRRWVDLGDPEHRVILEADSFAFHGSRDALVRDCRRYNEFTCAGWYVLRFAYEQVQLEPEWVAASVADVLALATSTARTRRKAG